jgi:hypothetical protein
VPSRLARIGRSLLRSTHIVVALAFAVALGRRVLTPAAAIDSDFMVFRSAWWLILHGQGSSLYDAVHQRAAQHLLMSPAEFKGGLMAFLNPPHAALAGLPFGWVADHAGLDAAFALWTLLNILLVIRLDFLLRAILGAERGEARWTATFALLAFFPLFYAIFIGQLSVLLAVAAFECYRALSRDRHRAAAAWLLVLSIKPQLVPPFLVLLAVRRDWTTLRFAAMFAGIAAALTAAALGPLIWLDYLRNLHALERFFAGGTPDHMMNVRGVLTRLVGSRLSIEGVYAISTGLWLIVMAALAFVLSHRRAARRVDLRADFALTMAAALFFSPHLFPQDALLWVVSLSLYGAWLRDNSPHAERFQLFIGLWPLLFIVTRAFDMKYGGPWFAIDPAIAVMMTALLLMTSRLTPSIEDRLLSR